MLTYTWLEMREQKPLLTPPCFLPHTTGFRNLSGHQTPKGTGITRLGPPAAGTQPGVFISLFRKYAEEKGNQSFVFQLPGMLTAEVGHGIVK